MSREKELVKGTFLLSLGRFLPKLVQIITLPIITACLTKSEYGTYDLINTLIMLLLPVATLQIQSAAFRFLIDCRKDSQRSTEIISSIFAVVVPVSAIVCLGIVVFTPSFNLLFKIILAVYFFWDSLQTTTAQIARGIGKTKAYSIASIALSWINGIGIVIALNVMNSGLTGVVISLTAANLISFLYLCCSLKLWKYISIKAANRDMIKKLISYSWPMIPNNLSNWALKLSDRLVITAYIGLEATAVYGVANKIPNILSIAHAVIANAWQENASIAVKDSDASDYYSRIFDHIFCLLTGATALLIGFMPLIFKLLIRGDYSEAYTQMPILTIAMFFYSLAGFQGGIYIAHKKTKSVGFTTIAAAVINLAIDFLLVKRIGITAGSISTLIAYAMLYVFRTIDSRKFQPMKYNIKKQLLLYAIIIVMLVFCFMKNRYLNIVNGIIGIIAFVVINQELLRKLFVNIIKVGKRSKN